VTAAVGAEALLPAGFEGSYPATRRWERSLRRYGAASHGSPPAENENWIASARALASRFGNGQDTETALRLLS